MAISLPSTALITEAEVQRDAMGSLPLNWTSARDEVRKAIIYASDLITTDFDRDLMVSEQVQYVEARDWYVLGGGPKIRTGLGIRWECTAEHWPIVEIKEAEVGRYGSTTSTMPVGLHPTTKLRYRRFTTVHPYDYGLTYFAGYRRREATLAEIQAYPDPHSNTGTPLAELTILPPPLPEDIYQACLQLTLMRLFELQNKTFGARSKSRLIGRDQVEVEANDPNARKRVLMGLMQHKRPR